MRLMRLDPDRVREVLSLLLMQPVSCYLPYQSKSGGAASASMEQCTSEHQTWQVRPEPLSSR